MLLGHFLQYLGITWLLNSRKLAEAKGSLGQRCISRLWRDPYVLLPAFLLAGGLFYILQTSIMAAAIALVLLHFYLDGLFWAFRKPEVRRAIGPYLLRRSIGPATAVARRSVADAQPAHQPLR